MICGKAAVFDFADVFAEGGDPFLLKTAVFGEEIPVGFRVAGESLVVLAEDVVGKKELGVAPAARPQRHEQERGFCGKECRELVRHDFELGGVGTGTLEFLHFGVKLRRLGGGFSNGAVVRPGKVTRDEPKVTDHGNTLAGHRFDDVGLAEQ